jgi:hypothetical protein
VSLTSANSYETPPACRPRSWSQYSREAKTDDQGGDHSYSSDSDEPDERTNRQPSDLSGEGSGLSGEQEEGSGVEGGEPARPQGSGSSPFKWRIKGYTAAEHVRIFRDAVASGKYDARTLRFLVEGNPTLEKIAGKVLPEDRPVRRYDLPPWQVIPLCNRGMEYANRGKI